MQAAQQRENSGNPPSIPARPPALCKESDPRVLISEPALTDPDPTDPDLRLQLSGIQISNFSSQALELRFKIHKTQELRFRSQFQVLDPDFSSRSQAPAHGTPDLRSISRLQLSKTPELRLQLSRLQATPLRPGFPQVPWPPACAPLASLAFRYHLIGHQEEHRTRAKCRCGKFQGSSLVPLRSRKKCLLQVQFSSQQRISRGSGKQD